MLFVHVIVFDLQNLKPGMNGFRQKKTKLKYIAQQIAAFEVYAGYLEERI